MNIKNDTGTGPSTPLAGREDELEFLLTELGAALKGKGRLVLVSGEAGIGKTRLVEELGVIARSLGCQVAFGRCLPGPPCPYLPFQEAFRSLTPIQSEGLAPTMPLHGSKRKCATPEGGAMFGGAVDVFATRKKYGALDEAYLQQESVFFEAMEIIKIASDKSSLLLIIEDLHWADSASAQLLHFLARSISRACVLIVGTYRPEDIIEKEGSIFNFRTSLTDMRREGIFQELQLKSLPDAEIGMTLTYLLDGAIDGAVVRRIAKESGGNPLFAIEISKLLASAHILELQEGAWRFVKHTNFDLPQTVREVILRRLARLNASERRVIECASVVGESFDQELISRILSLPLIDVLEILEKMAKKDLLLTFDDYGYRFCHEKVQRASYEEISSPRRRELHRLVGLALEERPLNDCVVGALSNHFYEAGILQKCVKYSLIAGKRCNSKCAGAEAVHYFQRILEIRNGARATDSEWRETEEGLGDAYFEKGDYQSAFDLYEELLEAPVNEDEKARLLRKCCDCWTPQKLGKGDVIRHAEFLQRALACEKVTKKERAEILRDAAVESIWRGDFAEADRLSLEAVLILKSEGEMEIAAWELACHALVMLAEGTPEKAMADCYEAKEILKDHPWPRGELETSLFLGQALVCLGKDEAAFLELDKAIGIAERLGDLYSISWATFFEALSFELHGNHKMAGIAAENSRSSALLSGNMNMVAMVDSFLVHINFSIGNLEGVESIFNEIMELVREPNLRIRSPLWGMVELARSTYLHLAGEIEASETSFKKGIELLEGVQFSTLYQGLGMVWHADSLIERGDLFKAEEVLRRAKNLLESISNKSASTRLERRIAEIVA